jgi:hypothetical protein
MGRHDSRSGSVRTAPGGADAPLTPCPAGTFPTALIYATERP